MIYLNNGSNVVTVTLAEKSTQVQPYYTWLLERKGTFDNVIFYQNDSSPIPYYWNSFTVSVVSTTPGLTSGIIKANSGEWTYTIYEMAAPYILDLTQAINEVETGICIINGTYTANHNYTGTLDDTIKYYKNM
jgi:ABC-type glycerol-3-phosphate transport system permease component